MTDSYLMGPDHPQVVRLLQNTKRFTQAEPLYRRALFSKLVMAPALTREQSP